jgi:predicted nuclease of predicted toxin-antitoxin system
VRFLVDAQLPPALARQIASTGHDAEHVGDCGFLQASDVEIWEHAHANGAVFITKDEDFVTMRALNASGPAIVWVRVGNTTRHALLSRFATMFSSILSALERGETVVEISDA